MTQVGAGTGLVPRLRRSDHLRDWFPALPGWAEVLTTGPPGLASIAIFAVSFLSQLATGKPVAPTAHRARRDDKSSSGLIPRGWAEVLTTGPPGPASIAIFAVSFLSQLATGKPTTPTARRGRRDDKFEAAAHLGSVEGDGENRATGSPHLLRRNTHALDLI
jgi:hypothetical protein